MNVKELMKGSFVKDLETGNYAKIYAKVTGFEGNDPKGVYILQGITTGGLVRRKRERLSPVAYEDIPYWLKAKTVDDIPAADEPRRVEASPEVDLKDIRIHSEILSRLLKQTVKGVKKYGDPVHHDNLTAVEWIDHAIDESVDQIVYLTALKHKLLAAEEDEKDEPGTK